MSTQPKNPSAAEDGNSYKVGDVITIPGDAPAAMVRLPDGSVCTVRGNYTARQTGQHAIVVVKDGETTETPFTVTGPAASTRRTKR